MPTESTIAMRRLNLDPQTIGRVYAQASRHPETAPLGIGRDPNLLVEVLFQPDTEAFVLGDFGGLLFATDVAQEEDDPAVERIARPHVLIWDRACYRKADEVRGLAAWFMRERRLHRLVSEVQAGNEMSVAFNERVGFHRIGVFRDRKLRDGSVADCVVFDALLRDLED